MKNTLCKITLLKAPVARNFFAAFLLGLLAFPAFAGQEASAILEQRRELIAAVDQEQGVEILRMALNDDSELIRRTAVHLLAHMGEDGRAGLVAAMRNDDPLIRRTAMAALADQEVLQNYWGTVLLDEDPAIQRLARLVWMDDHPLPAGDKLDALVAEFAEAYAEGEAGQRRHVISMLDGFAEFNDSMRELALTAIEDEDATVRVAAFETLYAQADRDWPQAADILAAAKADESEPVRELGTQLRWKFLQLTPLPLPMEGWKFQLDPNEEGREAGWYAVDFDDSDWLDDALIATHWQEFLDDAYIGAGWYRLTLDIPEVEDWNAAYLDFGGVDEGAWVWVNGEFVGEHDIGPDGWNVPFLLDVADQIKVGEANQITVLARNTTGGGGIWRPVHLRIINTELLD